MIHPIKSNMKNKFIHNKDRILLKKRVIVESVFDYLKNKFQLLHTRHRSILSTIAAYSLRKTKPRVRLYQRMNMKI